MIEISERSQRHGIRDVALELARKAHRFGRYEQAARAMARGAIDYMLSCPRWTHRPERAAVIARDGGWQVDNWLVHVLPSVDDSSILALRGLPNAKVDVEVIVPPWAEIIVKNAVKSLFPDGVIYVNPIDSYVASRVLSAGIELGESRYTAAEDFVRRYNTAVGSIALTADFK